MPTNLNPTNPGKTFRLVPSRVPGGTSDINQRPARVCVNAEEAARPLCRDLHRPPYDNETPVVVLGSQFTSLQLTGRKSYVRQVWSHARVY